MTEADKVFSLFPGFIQEYIYSHGWTELRDIQLQAAEVILRSDDNLLLSSSTASGKTEAAIFPVLTDVLGNTVGTEGFSVLYIAPLKSLINDQFLRLDELLDASGVKLTHWHGDVGASHKNKALKSPEGILQITPESLESMLMNRSNDIPRLFGALRYVIIDEVHALISSDRGNQVMCQLSRIARLIGRIPRRIGLSATLGDLDAAADWLGAGTGRKTVAPIPERKPLKWRLGFEHFYIGDPNEVQSTGKGGNAAEDGGVAALDAGYEYLYDTLIGKKALVFSNSREETEYVTATLRQIARARRDKDIFLIHHGNLSAALREDAEEKLKDNENREIVTCATVTLELGIDIGKLDRVAQIGSPTSVSSFLQRLGRSGRRATPPEMFMLYREEIPLPNAPLPNIIPWELLRGIALVELYSTERFIEPPYVKKLPLSLAFHQTLSTLFATGELSARELADRVLSLPPLASIDKETYRALLVSMINNEYLELTENKTLIVGLSGERIVNSFKFYAVFKDSEDYTVRCGSEEIGTITTPPPKGDRFALAGRVWEVIDLDVARKLVFVKAVDGKMEVSWPGESGEIHTKVLLAMHDVLFNGKDYAFLGDNARERLSLVRRVAAKAGLDKKQIVCLGGQSYCFFPWLGTRSFRTMKRLLVRYSSELGISDIDSEGCHYITFKAKLGAGEGLLEGISSILKRDGLNTNDLVDNSECPIYDKFDDYIPPELLRQAFAEDRLLDTEILERFSRLD